MDPQYYFATAIIRVRIHFQDSGTLHQSSSLPHLLAPPRPPPVLDSIPAYILDHLCVAIKQPTCLHPSSSQAKRGFGVSSFLVL